VFGEHQVAAGRTGEVGEARSQAETALAGYAAAWREMPRDENGDLAIMDDGTLAAAFLTRARRARLLAHAGEAVVGGRGMQSHAADSD
jgi:hypothetical protein